MGIETTFVDATDPDNVKKAIRPNTKLVWLETPTNPTLQLVDIQAVANIVKQHKDIIYVVDNTFMSSYFQQPLSLGADIAMHSLTKYMNGHSDSIMGCLCTSNEELYNRIKFLQNSFGAVPSPFECFLVNRGLKTLHLRMREHMRNGLEVAKYLESHPCVEKVIFPGLPSHPQHKLALRQCSGFSGMVSFNIRGGLTETNTFLKKLKVFILAESLGGYESLAEHPAVMTHASVPVEQRNKLGISDNLIRLSVGLESTDDLLNDLDQALRAAVV
jgi:cystathionine gamma-lyase